MKDELKRLKNLDNERRTEIEMSLEDCEAVYMDGSADEVSGNVDSHVGHFYRVERYIVVTDTQGFRDLSTFDTEDEAKAEFQRLDAEYGTWDDGE